jgi:arginase
LIVERIDVVGVPMDLGSDRRGVDMGPSAVRNAGLHEALAALGVAVHDHGDLHVPVRESVAQTDAHSKYLPVIRAVCSDLAAKVEGILRAGGFPLVIGGDHSIAMGTLAGVRRARSAAPGLIWIDAHGDINTPLTSPSGNVHGMPLSFALEDRSIEPECVALLGLRDVDPGERRTIRKLGVRAFTMSEIDRIGIDRVMEEAIAIASSGGRSVHVSFDLDGIDPSAAPGVGTPVRGGMTYREAHLAMEMAASSGTLGSLEFTEINPILDIQNATAILAVELILSALGKTIL